LFLSKHLNQGISIGPIRRRFQEFSLEEINVLLTDPNANAFDHESILQIWRSDGIKAMDRLAR
jgi:hypothetical protein